VLISVPDQKLAVVYDGEWIARYPVSTSRFGTGDNFYSYRTPLGELRICDKIGENLPPGAVIHHRAATGEVLPVNAPGRDPIVTRVIWLDGLEPQNHNARSRGIYIHGTPQEWTIGKPMSWGCIRMRSKDVIKFFDQVPVGTVVDIVPQKLPYMRRYKPPKVQPPPPPAPQPAQTSAPSPARSKVPQQPGPPPAEPSPHELTPPPLPEIGEGSEHGNSAALRSMKGSILLANIPGMDKPGEHHSKIAPQ
jgi:hypothetical protein